MNQLPLFILLFCYLSMPLYAQSTWVKGNLEFGHEQAWEQRSTVTSKSVRFALTDQSIQRFSLSAMHFPSVHTFFELGVSGSKSVTSGNLGEFVDTFNYSVQIGNVEKKAFQVMMEYGFNISNTKNELDAARSFWVSVFMNPYYKSLNFYNPKRTLDYPSQNSVLGFGFGLSPRILLPLGRSFLLDFNTKITLITLQNQKSTLENPALTPRQRESSVLDVDFPFSNLLLRVGLAWKIPGRKKTITE
ncbi:MAG: hypothetical protein ACOYPR_16110 [Saprospiraceae bacterium]